MLSINRPLSRKCPADARARKLLSRKGAAFIQILAMSSALHMADGVAAAPDVKIFDQIVTRDLIRSCTDPAMNFSFQVTSQGEARTYRASFDDTLQTDSGYYMLFVSASPAGTLLDPTTYAQSRAEAEAAGDRSHGQLTYEFPAIGKRAKREVYGAGPGGASFGLAFTTCDTQFDARVVIANSLRDDAPIPQVNVECIARSISRAYNFKSERRQVTDDCASLLPGSGTSCDHLENR